MNHAMTTSSLFHTDIQRLWKHSPFKVPADSLHLQMLQISMGIWFWHLLLSSHELIYTRTPEKIIIIIKLTYYHILFHFPHPHPHTHIQKTDINARTHTQNLKLTTTWPWCPEASTEDQIENPACLHWPDFVSVWIYLHYGPAVLTMTEKPELRYYKDFSKSLSGCEKRVTNVCLVDQFDPDTEKNIIYEKKQHFFSIQNLTQSRKDAYSNEGLRLQNVLNAKNTHTHTHRHTHTHTHTHTRTHGTHTPIDIHYNINNVSAGKLISFWLFDLS